MKPFLKLTLLTGTVLGAFASQSLSAATLIIKDDFNVAANGDPGFVLNEGANAGINPPQFTRLEGVAKDDLRYINLWNRPTYYINNNKLRINNGAQGGRFTLGDSNGEAFDFGPALGVATASPDNPITYDVTISLYNNASSARQSFGISTVASDVTTWDFGIQISRIDDNTFALHKRINSDSCVANVSINSTTGLPTAPRQEVHFRLRITDAGAEAEGYNSRIQLFVNDSSEPVYDTATDPDLGGGWRFDAPQRYLVGDIPGGNGNYVTYDNLSIVLNPDGEVDPASIALPAGTPGDLTLNFAGTPRTTYQVERTSQLGGTWQTIGTITTDDTTGEGSYTDKTDYGSQNSFYRIRAY